MNAETQKEIENVLKKNGFSKQGEVWKIREAGTYGIFDFDLQFVNGTLHIAYKQHLDLYWNGRQLEEWVEKDADSLIESLAIDLNAYGGLKLEK